MMTRRRREQQQAHCTWQQNVPRQVTLRLLLAAGVAMCLAPFVAMVIGRSVVSGASATQTSPSGTVTVTVEAIATARSGATDRPQATVTRAVPVGGRVAAAFAAGGADGTDLCELASVPGPEAGVGRVRWRVEATVEAADGSTVTLALAWERSVVQTATGSSSVPLSDQRTVRLRSGEDHVLDLVQADPGSASPCANILVRVRAALVEPPVRMRRWLTYDLWLTYERAGTERATRQLKLAGPEDVPVAATFMPLRWTLSGTWARTPSLAGMQVTVSGTLRGHCRADGAIDLTLDMVRTVTVGDGVSVGAGHKQVVLTVGQAVAVEVPNPTGTSTGSLPGAARAPKPWAPGVEGSADTVTVDLNEYFRGSRFLFLVSGRCE